MNLTLFLDLELDAEKTGITKFEVKRNDEVLYKGSDAMVVSTMWFLKIFENFNKYHKAIKPNYEELVKKGPTKDNPTPTAIISEYVTRGESGKSLDPEYMNPVKIMSHAASFDTACEIFSRGRILDDTEDIKAEVDTLFDQLTKEEKEVEIEEK